MVSLKSWYIDRKQVDEMNSRKKVTDIFSRCSNGYGAAWTGHPNDKTISAAYMKRLTVIRTRQFLQECGVLFSI